MKPDVLKMRFAAMIAAVVLVVGTASALVACTASQDISNYYGTWTFESGTMSGTGSESNDQLGTAMLVSVYNNGTMNIKEDGSVVIDAFNTSMEYEWVDGGNGTIVIQPNKNSNDSSVFECSLDNGKLVTRTENDKSTTEMTWVRK